MKKQETQFSIISDYYANHLSEIRAYVCSRLINTDDAEDIVQNVFLRLLTADGVLTPSTLANLVYTIARNMIYDYFRHRRSVDEYVSFVSDNGSRVTSEASVYNATEIHELLERGMARLTDTQRKIYRMNIYDGLAVSDISKTLNIKYKTVESRLGLARKEIRQYMTRMLA